MTMIQDSLRNLCTTLSLMTNISGASGENLKSSSPNVASSFCHSAGSGNNDDDYDFEDDNDKDADTVAHDNYHNGEDNSHNGNIGNNDYNDQVMVRRTMVMMMMVKVMVMVIMMVTMTR